MNTRHLLPLFTFLLHLMAGKNTLLYSQTDSGSGIVNKTYTTSRISIAPRIDGSLDEEVWKNTEAASGFVQSNPLEGVPASQRTEAYILYDNTSLYIGAMLYDSAPDSILKQLGNRDEWVTADQFRVVFDTYNTQLDAFEFSVTASGVQQDYRFSDYNYDAVWESAVKILSNGWSVEMRIPYSAIRFPVKEEQVWGLQITRSLQRKNEFIQWALTPKKAPNSMVYWGKLHGLKNISPPLRLSLSPYLSLILQRTPETTSTVNGENTTYSNSLSYGGGADIKYGINESFTLDATLLPDFSQVQSDDIRKNLRAFEIEYDEQRPFFQEGVELFNRGGLFYSRRIGKTPAGFYAAGGALDSVEVLEKNPNQAKLLNSTKISGRTKHGLGIGILNAVVDHTYALARNPVTGSKRKILTEPFSNYNIFVLDQQLKNSSSVFLVNTNVVRTIPKSENPLNALDSSAFDDANVSGAGLSLNNRKNTYGIYAEGIVSNTFTRSLDPEAGTKSTSTGFRYRLGFSKKGGKLRYGINHWSINKNFDNNDMGIIFETNYSANSVWINYWEYEPFGRFLNASLNFSVDQSIYLPDAEKGYLKSKNWKDLGMGFNLNGTFKNFTYLYFNLRGAPLHRKDYYEARTPGKVFIRYPFLMGFLGFGTNGNKRFSMNADLRLGSTSLIDDRVGYDQWLEISINPRLRVNDRFSLRMELEYNPERNDRGWVSTDKATGTIYFGQRNLATLTQGLEAKYLFRNNLSLSLNGRHYWSRGDYTLFFELLDDGFLMQNLSYSTNHDFNFNAFTIDMLFEWQFAPGSTINLVWKNAIYNEDTFVIRNYGDNLDNMLNAPQTNTLSLKVLYYLDYLYLSKLKQDTDRRP